MQPTSPSFRPRLATAFLGPLTLAVAAGLLAACGSKPPPEPPKPIEIAGRFEATATLNPSVSNRPSPLLVRVYELRSPTVFNRADFMALYQSDNATLAADLVAREETMLQPGESRAFTRTLAADTRYIGVVAAYRELERSTWRAVVAVERPAKPGPVKLVIQADARTVTAVVQP